LLSYSCPLNLTTVIVNPYAFRIEVPKRLLSLSFLTLQTARMHNTVQHDRNPLRQNHQANPKTKPPCNKTNRQSLTRTHSHTHTHTLPHTRNVVTDAKTNDPCVMTRTPNVTTADLHVITVDESRPTTSSQLVLTAVWNKGFGVHSFHIQIQFNLHSLISKNVLTHNLHSR